MNAVSLTILALGSMLAGIGTYLCLQYYWSDYLVVQPIFTASAYSDNGFYDYYTGKCNIQCLTVPISENDFNPTVSFSDTNHAQQILRLIGFRFITDIDLSNGNYDHNKTLIFLHNEYMTYDEFNNMNNSKFIMLYPNNAYAQIKMDNYTNINNYISTTQPTITLIKGHGYLTKENAFGWRLDNSKLEIHNGNNVYCDTNKDMYEKIGDNYRLNCWTNNYFDILKYVLEIKNLH